MLKSWLGTVRPSVMLNLVLSTLIYTSEAFNNQLFSRPVQQYTLHHTIYNHFAFKTRQQHRKASGIFAKSHLKHDLKWIRFLIKLHNRMWSGAPVSHRSGLVGGDGRALLHKIQKYLSCVVNAWCDARAGRGTRRLGRGCGRRRRRRRRRWSDPVHDECTPYIITDKWVAFNYIHMGVSQAHVSAKSQSWESIASRGSRWCFVY